MAPETLSIPAGAAASTAAELRSLVAAPAALGESVAAIIARVRDGGDAALAELVAEHDMAGGTPPPLRVAQAELERAEAAIAPELRAAVSQAFENVFSVARMGVGPARQVISRPGSEVVLREAALERAAVYVPGGRAPYPSTVVMGVAAARAAEVREVVVCSPPTHGDVHGAILAACRLTGVSEVFRMGGAHAVAALAHGTETVRPVDVIVGPGNVYVQEAKRQVSERVAIDGFAGPSDLLVLVEEDGAPADWVALDLLAQAEHGQGSLVVVVSTSADVLRALSARLESGSAGAVIRLAHAPTLEDALALIQALAPEHIQLMGPRAEALAPRVTHAGCVFVGAASGTAFGDYIAGSNHILPTRGTARFASALSAPHFRRRFTEVRVTDPSRLAHAAAPLARAEGFELHAESMEARIRENRP